MKEKYRERRAFAPIENTAQDIRYAIRTLRKNPGYTATCIAVLALAIGANTAMFSVLNAVLLRPLPYRSPDRLAMLWTEHPHQNRSEGRTAYWNVEQWRQQSKSFSDMAVFDGVSVTLTTANSAEQISAARVSPNFFPLLGVQPLHGRIFSAKEAGQRERLAVISYNFWQTHFGGSRNAIGSSIDLDRVPLQIVGILPPGFHFAGIGAEVWEPDTLFPDWETRRGERGEGTWSVVGRLRPKVTVDQAQAEMSTIAHRLDAQMPASERNLGIRVVPLRLQIVGPRSRLILWLLAGAVFCVLLIAVANVAGLSLARAAIREREMAIRSALGASRSRMFRQLLAESLTLAVLSGAAGLLVAQVAIRVILAARSGNLARLDEISLDPRVLACTLALCLLAGILVGLAPVIAVLRRNPMPPGHREVRGISGGMAARKIRRALVVAEFALAILLLTGAGLLIRSLQAVENVRLGFQPQGVLAMQIALPEFGTLAQRTSLYRRILEQIESLPGVESAGIIGDFVIGSNPEQIVTAEENGASALQHLQARRDEISGGFFATVRTPLLRGRFFSAEDGPGAPRVAIINDAMARRLWPGSNPVGKRFKFGAWDSAAPPFTVVGVVGNMRRQGLENEPIPQVFEPLAQNSSRHETILVRTSADHPLAMAESVKAGVHRVATHLPLYHTTTLENRLGPFLTERRFETWLLIAFSVIALLLAAVGIYGLVQYSVATRKQEIGIRMALGAQTGEIFRMVVGEGLKLGLTGLGIGLVAALCLGRTASSLLFGVTASDPLTLAAVSLLLAGAAAAACYFPARQAMKIEPLAALRQE
jgi:putative ABC transport system permease protein